MPRISWDAQRAVSISKYPSHLGAALAAGLDWVALNFGTADIQELSLVVWKSFYSGLLYWLNSGRLLLEPRDCPSGR